MLYFPPLPKNGERNLNFINDFLNLSNAVMPGIPT